MSDLKIVYKKVDELTPYENNPRNNDNAVEAVAKSIKEFGFKVPLVIDKEGEIAAGHTRLKAAKELGLEEVPCIIADDLTPEQVKDFRLADNKVAEFAEWDIELLNLELEELSLEDLDFEMADFGFEIPDVNPSKTIWDKIEENPLDSRLADSFIEPPFSILDTRQGRWVDRNRLWKERGIKGYEGRGDNLTFTTYLSSNTLSTTSVFDPTLTELMYLWFGKENMNIIDPFTGGITRGGVASLLGHSYTGFDIRREQLDANKEIAIANNIPLNNINWVLDDSVNINKYVEDETQDLLFTCPPYFNLEVYSDLENDISNMDYDGFKEQYSKILTNSYKTLKENSFAIIVLSDVRDKQGEYLRLCDLTKDVSQKNGLHFYNELILINIAGSASLRARRNMRNRKTVRVHQNVLVFYKGDMSKIQQHFPELKDYKNIEE